MGPDELRHRAAALSARSGDLAAAVRAARAALATPSGVAVGGPFGDRVADAVAQLVARGERVRALLEGRAVALRIEAHHEELRLAEERRLAARREAQRRAAAASTIPEHAR